MVRIFGLHVPRILLGLAALDALLVYGSIQASLSATRGVMPTSLAELHVWTFEKLLFVAAIMISLFMMGLYRQRYFRDFAALATRTGVALAFAFGLMTVCFYFVPSDRIWMSAMLPALLAALIVVLLNRGILQRMPLASRLKSRVLVLGAGRQAQRVEAIERILEPCRFTCIGFVPFGEPCMVDPSRLIASNDLVRVSSAMGTDEIVVALDDRRNTLPVEALLECRLRGKRVLPLPTFVERELGQVDVDFSHPSWFTFADSSSYGGHYRHVKRAFDIAASAVFLFLNLPLIALVALAILIEDGFPILYRQERVGLNGGHFSIFKFRSMVRDAEKAGARWAMKDDPRVTRVGAFIRKTRIDEIPQVWNVLKGDMSLIGPRPERPNFVAEIAKEVPYYQYRHLVRPGITGWAQINFEYGASIAAAKEKLKYDLYYVKNWGFLLDAVVLLQSVRVILWGEGAR